MLEPTSEGVVLIVHVQPKASKTEFVGIHGDALKFRVAAPPVEGAANAALCEHLAALFSVSKSGVTVLSGHTSRRKRIKIVGLTSVQVREKLDIS